MPFRKYALAVAFSILIAGCGGGGGSVDTVPQGPGAGVVQGSSASASGSTAVYTDNGVTYAATPGAGASGAVGARILTLPNTGQMAVGARMVSAVSARSVATTTGDVNGVAIDPENDIGAAYAYDSGVVSIFRISTGEEVSTYDTLTSNTISFTGARFTKITGIVMEPSTRTMIIGTADGYETVDYSDPASLSWVTEVPSTEADWDNGVEMIENFAYHNKLVVAGAPYRMIITGGKASGRGDHAMVLVDASTGAVYRPDAATGGLFHVDEYLDAAAVDTSYHVAVFADESVGTVFVDLNQLTLDAANGTYSLPSAAVERIRTYMKFTNLAIDSSRHMVMMGKGYHGTELVVAELKNPAAGLGFAKEALITMPDGVDDRGGAVVWRGSLDPHGAGAYVTGAENPSYPASASMGIWANGESTHIAVINLKNVLDGALSGAPYDPQRTTPKDISYFRIP